MRHIQPVSSYKSIAKPVVIFFFVLLGSAFSAPANGDFDSDMCMKSLKAKDYSTAFPPCLKVAEQGNSDVQNSLGNLYFNGQGVTKDYQKALEWYRKAAIQGFAAAQLELGKMFYKGEGVKQDFAEALTWFRKAAEQGNAPAQATLGQMHYFGEGVKQNYIEAAAWYRKAAEQGLSDAQYNLGLLHYKGDGVKQDFAVAVVWLRKAAEQGDVSSQAMLGDMYHYGKGVKQSDSEALLWNRKAAENENATAQYHLGALYENGLGCNKNYSEAAKWYRKAAEHGLAIAQSSLGTMYSNGLGVKQDYKEAMKWYKKAVEHGNAGAQRNIGVMYENGWGVKQNYNEAFKWYRMAAELDECPLKTKYLADYQNSTNEGLVFLKQIINNAQSHSDVIKNIKKMSPKKNHITIDNMRINYTLYTSLHIPLEIIAGILNTATEQDKNTATYALITAERNKIGTIQSDIYNYSYAFEQKAFKKANGLVYKSGESPLLWLLNKRDWYPSWKPEKGYYYNLEGMVAMQSTNNGILMTGYIPGSKTAFLYTNTDFVDGASLNGFYVIYVGTYKYQSLLGLRNIYAFKLFTPSNTQVINGKQFYFYPQIVDNIRVNDTSMSSQIDYLRSLKW